jgi:hypothetical protein
MLKHRIRDYLVKEYGKAESDGTVIYYTHCVFGARSCEMLAEELITQFNLSKCEVNEDNENGAIVTVQRVY